MAKLFYFCHLKKLVRPETSGPYHVPSTRVSLSQNGILTIHRLARCSPQLQAQEASLYSDHSRSPQGEAQRPGTYIYTKK